MYRVVIYYCCVSETTVVMDEFKGHAAGQSFKWVCALNENSVVLICTTCVKERI